jgi:hypothetical protein
LSAQAPADRPQFSPDERGLAYQIAEFVGQHRALGRSVSATLIEVDKACGFSHRPWRAVPRPDAARRMPAVNAPADADFVRRMARLASRKPLTERQADWLADIYDSLGGS